MNISKTTTTTISIKTQSSKQKQTLPKAKSPVREMIRCSTQKSLKSEASNATNMSNVKTRKMPMPSQHKLMNSMSLKNFVQLPTGNNSANKKGNESMKSTEAKTKSAQNPSRTQKQMTSLAELNAIF